MANKKLIWWPEAVTRIFNYLSIITSNKTNQEPTATLSNILLYLWEVAADIPKKHVLLKNSSW